MSQKEERPRAEDNNISQHVSVRMLRNPVTRYDRNKRRREGKTGRAGEKGNRNMMRVKEERLAGHALPYTDQENGNTVSLPALRASIQRVGLSAGLDLLVVHDTLELGSKGQTDSLPCLAIYHEGHREYAPYVVTETEREGRPYLDVYRTPPARGFFGRRRKRGREEMRYDRLIERIITDAIFWCQR